jgi:predicted ATP-dependent serine protease
MTGFDPHAFVEQRRQQRERESKANGVNGSARPNGHDPRPTDSFSDVELMAGEIAEPVFIVPGLIPEGLTIVSGRPKMGKTTFVMNIADAVARGGVALGTIPCPKHDVLFLALEDNRRRLRKRRRMMLDAQQLSPVPALRFELEWPRLDDGGLERLEKACADSPALKLIVIDTWKKISPHRGRNADDYEHESRAATLLQKLAAKHQIAIIIIHHSRKGMGSEDFVDDVLGSTGLTGAVDTIIGFRRKRGTSDAEISVTGRDVDEAEKGLAGDQTTGLWRIVGDASVVRLSCQRKAIMDLLKDGKLRRVKEISDILGERYDTVRMTCARMHDDGQLAHIGQTYGVPS